MTQGRYAIVVDGVVDNIIVADDAFAAEQGGVACPSGVEIGWTYDGDDFAAPIVSPEDRRATIRPVTMRQARLALLAAGVLGDVAPALAALPSPHRDAAEIEWEYASEVRRDAPLIAALGGALGLTEDQIDDLFEAASAL